MNIQSRAEAGFPLTILADTNLSADNLSAFSEKHIIGLLTELATWRVVNTRMTVVIKKQGEPTPFFSNSAE